MSTTENFSELWLLLASDQYVLRRFECRCGQRHGHGVFKSETGEVYDGEWADGKVKMREYLRRVTVDGHLQANGRGKRTYADGACFEGSFLDGKTAKSSCKQHAVQLVTLPST